MSQMVIHFGAPRFLVNFTVNVTIALCEYVPISSSDIYADVKQQYNCLVAAKHRRGYKGPPTYVSELFYGQLNDIVVCEIPDTSFWGDMRGTIRLLALITPCKTGGNDAAKVVVEYTKTSTQIVTDLQTICAVVGRVKTRNRWGIIDRTDGLASTKFVDM